MAEADISEFVLKLIIIALFAIVIIGGILLITEFKATVKTLSLSRLGIDFGENVLSSSCTADVKGLLNETKLNKEKTDYDDGKNGLSGFSCIKSAFRARTLVKISETTKWNFGIDEKRKYLNMYEFPAAVNMSDGTVLPAILKVVAEASAECNYENNGNNCYNCMKKEDCENAGCAYSSSGLCKPK